MNEQMTRLRTELQTMTNQAKALYADLEAKGEKATADERAALNTLIDQGTAKRKELERLQELDAADALVNRPAAPAKATLHSTVGTQPRRKTWGRQVIESDQFQRARKGSTAEMPKMDRVNVKAEQKAIYESVESAGGALLDNERLPDLINLPQRPQSVLNLITISRTTSDVVEWVEVATRTNSAAPVPERSGGNFGLKPESDMTFTLKTSNVRTIATWIGASRNILRDVPRLQDMIDGELTENLRVVLENQIIAGNGTGENFAGIINTAGILTRTQGSGARAKPADTIADTVRRGVTDIQLEFYTPNGVLFHPADYEEIELQKDTTGQYVMLLDAATGRLWRLQVAVSPVVSFCSSISS
jgi:HK97 family phage major capsid protein